VGRIPESKAIVLVPFVCPICAASHGVHLISVTRAGGTACPSCGKWLRLMDVVRAIHDPRRAKHELASP